MTAHELARITAYIVGQGHPLARVAPGVVHVANPICSADTLHDLCYLCADLAEGAGHVEWDNGGDPLDVTESKHNADEAIVRYTLAGNEPGDADLLITLAGKMSTSALPASGLFDENSLFFEITRVISFQRIQYTSYPEYEILEP